MKFTPNKNKSIDLKKIEQLNFDGKGQQVKALLISYVKNFNKLIPHEQNILLGLLFNYNFPDEALKCIKNEMTIPELKKCSDHLLLTQMRFSRILVLVGCEDAAVRIARNVIREVASRNDIDPFISATVLVLGGTTFFGYQKYDELKSSMEIFCLKSLPGSHPELFQRLKFYVVHSANYMVTDISQINLDAYDELKKNIQNENFNESIDIAVFSLQMDFLLEDIDSLIKTISESEVFNREYIKVWKHFYTAVLKKAQGKKEESCESLLNALELGQERNIQNKMGMSYYNEVLGCSSDLLADRVFFRCYPCSNTYSFLIGNRFLKDLHCTTPLMRLESAYLDDDNDFDSWLVSNGEIKKIKYDKYHNSQNCIDLVAGMFFRKNKRIALTGVRTKCLMSIIGGGSFGIHEILIADRTYGDEVFYPESARLRIRTLVNQIEKMEIKIKRHKGYVFYDFSMNNYDIIFPRDHRFCDKFSYVKKQLEVVNIKNLKDCLGVKPSTASLYIKTWKMEGLIVAVESDRYGDYKRNKGVDTPLAVFN